MRQYSGTSSSRYQVQQQLELNLTKTNQQSWQLAAQQAADSDNYCTAITRACTFNKVTTISKTNMKIVYGLYPDPCHTRKPTNTPHTKNSRAPPIFLEIFVKYDVQLGTKGQASTATPLTPLLPSRNHTNNQFLQTTLFNIIYQGQIPPAA